MSDDSHKSTFAPISTQTRKAKDEEGFFDQFTNQEILSDAELIEQLTLLQEKLSLLSNQVEKAKLKTQIQQTQAKTSACVLLDKVAPAVLSAPGGSIDVYPLHQLLVDLVISVEKELKSNEELIEKNLKSKRPCFELTHKTVQFVRKAIQKELVCDGDKSILQLCYKLQKFAVDNGSFGFCSLSRDLLYAYAGSNPVVSWNSVQVEKLWKLNVGVVLKSIRDGDVRRSENWIRVIVLLMDNLRFTVLSTDIRTNAIGLLEKVCDAATEMNNELWMRKSPSLFYFLDLFSLVIDNYGALYRHIILDKLVSVARCVCDNLSELWTTGISNHTSGSDQTVLSYWGFMERVVALACPSGYFSSKISPPKVIEMASTALDTILAAIIKMTKSAARASFSLPNGTVQLIARFLALCELPEIEEGEREPPTKRTRNENTLQMLCELALESSSPSSLVTPTLTILRSFYANYSVWCMPSASLSAVTLWSNKDKFIKAKDLLCSVLVECVRLQSMQCLLPEIASWVLSNCCGEAAAQLCQQIAFVQPEMIQVSTVIEMMSRSKSIGKNAISLLSETMCRSQFDVAPQSNSSSEIDRWKARLDIINLILENSDCDVEQVLLNAMTYFPTSSSLVVSTSSNCEKTFEDVLTESLLLNDRRTSLQSTHYVSVLKEKPTVHFPLVVIPEVSEELRKTFRSNWDKGDLIRRVYIWRQLILLLSRLEKEDIAQAQLFNEAKQECEDWLGVRVGDIPLSHLHLLYVPTASHLLSPAFVEHLNEAASEAQTTQQAVLFAVAAAPSANVPPHVYTAFLDWLVVNVRSTDENGNLQAVCVHIVSQLLEENTGLYAWIKIVDKYHTLLNDEFLTQIMEQIGSAIESEAEMEEESVLSVYSRLLESLPVKCFSDKLLETKELKTSSAEVVVMRLDCVHSSVLLQNQETLLQSPALAPLIVRRYLTAPTLSAHAVEIISKLYSDQKLYAVCSEFLPELESLLDFHAVALLSKKKIDNLSRKLSLLEQEEVVVWSRNGRDIPLPTYAFPLAFRADIDDLPFVCHQTVSHLTLTPHLVLSWLRSEVTAFCKAHMEFRFVQLLVLLVKEMTKARYSVPLPLSEVFSACLCTVIQSCVNRKLNAVEMSVVTNEWKSLCKDVFIPNIGLLRFKEIVMSYQGRDTSSLSIYVSEFADKFLRGELIDANCFFMPVFWNEVQSKLELGVEVDQRVVDHLHLLMDIVPSVNNTITPLLGKLLTQTPDTVPYVRVLHDGDDDLVHIISFYCSVMVATDCEERFSVFYSIFSLMTCPELQNNEMSEMTKGSRMTDLMTMDSSTFVETETTPTSLSDLCVRILNMLDTNITMIRLLVKLVPEQPSLSLLLLPILCALSPDYVEMVMSCERWIAHDLSPREVRCLAESMDSLCVPSIVGCSLVETDPQRISDLCTTLLKNSFVHHARLLFNIYCESVLNPSRHSLLFNCSPSTHPLSHCDEASQLSTSFHTKTRNSPSLLALPSKQQMSTEVRQVVWMEASDWINVLCDQQVSVNGEQEILSEAAFSAGITLPNTQFPDPIVYQDAWRMRQWNRVPFPNRIDDVEKATYALLQIERTQVGDDKIKGVAKTLKDTARLSLSHMQLNREHVPGLLRFDRILRVEPVEHKEDVLSLAIQTVRSFAQYERRRPGEERVETVVRSCPQVFEYIRLLREKNKFKPALNVLRDWKHLCESVNAPDETRECILEECAILRRLSEDRHAEYQLNLLIEPLSKRTRLEERQSQALARAYIELSELAETRGDLHSTALGYAQQASELCPEEGSFKKIRSDVSAQLYKLASAQLEDVEAYCESRAFCMKKEAVKTWDEQIQKLSNPSNSAAGAHDCQQTLKRLKNERRCEMEDVELTDKRLRRTAAAALEAGLQLISHADTDKATQIVFSVINLLFRYANESNGSEELISLLRSHIPCMDVRKWLPTISHIASHAFKKIPLGILFREIVIRLVRAYPYHTANVLLFYQDQMDKSTQVMDILVSACAQSAECKAVLGTMKKGHRIYKEFSALDIKSSPDIFKPTAEKNKFSLSPSVCIRKHITLLRKLPLPTVELPVGLPNDYSTDSLPMWNSVNEKCFRADGISAPTVISVTSSDGKEHKVIFKKEDVRGDSLVEQLFSVVNSLIGARQDPHPLRTYKVVPLDEKYGLIEWCMGTTSLKSILCGEDRKSGLHKEIFPNDMTSVEAIMKFHTSVPSERARLFDKVCQNINPVFRHYFYRNFITAAEWATHLDAYTRSLAQWSIVCYVVGLGDRHLSNILFEPSTCRFVHIDLGMILEFSKRNLPLPELVPFRMTRDLVDPLLCDGVHGSLEKIAVDTMSCLRENRQVILGVASVFLRESINTVKKEHMEDGSMDHISQMATSRLCDKLMGCDGTVTTQTPQSQVRRLLIEATRRENLARIFHGWMPWI